VTHRSAGVPEEGQPDWVIREGRTIRVMARLSAETGVARSPICARPRTRRTQWRGTTPTRPGAAGGATARGGRPLRASDARGHRSYV